MTRSIGDGLRPAPDENRVDCRAQTRRDGQLSRQGKTLTGMPKTDLSAWLTSPLAIVKVVQKRDATTRRKRGDGEVSRRTPGMKREKREKRKKRKEEKGRKGEKKNTARWETSAQSGGAVHGIYGNDRVLFPAHAEFSRAEKICIRISLQYLRSIFYFVLYRSIDISILIYSPLFNSSNSYMYILLNDNCQCPRSRSNGNVQASVDTVLAGTAYRSPSNAGPPESTPTPGTPSFFPARVSDEAACHREVSSTTTPYVVVL